MLPQQVLFTVQGGDKPCTSGGKSLTIQLNGMNATCGDPRPMYPGSPDVAGCASNPGDVRNECLWNITVPRPGTPEWAGDACFPQAAFPPDPPSPAPGARPSQRAPPVPVVPCSLVGPSSDVITFGTVLSCYQQANCIDLQYDSSTCEWRSVMTVDDTTLRTVEMSYLYCNVCLSYPRASTCTLPKKASLDYICIGDEMSEVIDPGTGELVPGGVNPTNGGWDRDQKYCQEVRWTADDFAPQSVRWSIRGGGSSGRCNKAGDPDLVISLKGIDAQCGPPRLNALDGFAGCQGNDDISDECLWTLAIPRPGGPGWCSSLGPSTELRRPPPGSKGCGDQATCLDASLDSSKCVYKLQKGLSWLYCPVTLAWPRAGSQCVFASAKAGGSGRRLASSGDELVDGDDALSSDVYSDVGRGLLQDAGPLGTTLDTVCSGDKLGSVIEGPGGVPVPGGIDQVTPWHQDEVQVQWIRWALDDLEPQQVLFTVRAGDKACSSGGKTVVIQLNGMNATCGGPRYMDARESEAAGCASNTGNVFNECLWSITVPRPGTPEWAADTCLPDNASSDSLTMSPSPKGAGEGDGDGGAASPPPRSVRPGRRAPPLPGSGDGNGDGDGGGKAKPPPKGASPGSRAPPLPEGTPVIDDGTVDAPFPFCACKARNMRNTPYRLRYNSTTRVATLGDGAPRAMHCFDLQVVDCDPGARCCAMGLAKAELFSVDACRSAVKLALVGGQSTSWSFSQTPYHGVSYTTFKLPAIGLARPEVPASSQLCFVTATSPCLKLGDFCRDGADGFCRFALYNEDESCCPTSSLDIVESS
ncbi:hypothetical protein HYH03_007203 [Edaphochlamys debaryana]|uniref:Pherophorin domain-containing protein n=1 Tax=Edaphochlamys debaryana TaxID=47281 RepID=A0A835Y149_9CHLO|nr:hypothetical protein HYH03_007203 [Edaphochlamys debaryana]|eukprot:KAG2494687.1 hypothetical protein HYH03_007203 [Edaphochlamys debaryana]